jgi:hypothetical protein
MNVNSIRKLAYRAFDEPVFLNKAIKNANFSK